jgi:hypothetical protein
LSGWAEWVSSACTTTRGPAGAETARHGGEPEHVVDSVVAHQGDELDGMCDLRPALRTRAALGDLAVCEALGDQVAMSTSGRLKGPSVDLFDRSTNRPTDLSARRQPSG